MQGRGMQALQRFGQRGEQARQTGAQGSAALPQRPAEAREHGGRGEAHGRHAEKSSQPARQAAQARGKRPGQPCKAETEQERQADGPGGCAPHWSHPGPASSPGGAGAQLPELFHFLDSFRPRRADCACIFGALMLECTCSGNICTSLVNRRSHIWHSFRNTISWRPRRCRRFSSRSPRQSGCWRPVRSQR